VGQSSIKVCNSSSSLLKNIPSCIYRSTWISQVTGVNWQRVSLESCDVGIDLNVLLRETQLRVVAPNIRPPNLDFLQVLHSLKNIPSCLYRSTWISQVTGVNWQRVSLESCDVFE